MEIKTSSQSFSMRELPWNRDKSDLVGFDIQVCALKPLPTDVPWRCIGFNISQNVRSSQGFTLLKSIFAE